MKQDYATLAGQLLTWPSKNTLAGVLLAAGLRIKVGRYSIRIEECENFAFQQLDGDRGDPCIVADAETVEKMIVDAHLVSRALGDAGIKHRFEVYDTGDDLAAYLHHQWPLVS